MMTTVSYWSLGSILQTHTCMVDGVRSFVYACYYYCNIEVVCPEPPTLVKSVGGSERDYRLRHRCKHR